MTSKDIECFIQEQDSNAAKLQQAISNYKKSPLVRKTLDYIESYLQNINELWGNFDRLDKRFRAEQLIPEDHFYFKNDIYTAISDIYTEIRSKMESEIFQLRSNIIQPSSSKAAIYDDISSEIQKEKQMIDAIIRMLNQVLDTSGGSIQFFKTKLRVIEQHYEHANALHTKLWTNAAYNNESYFQMEETITNGIIKIQELIAAGDVASVTRTSSAVDNLQLPKIELPKFDGNYLNWRNFFDLFSELVYRRSLPPCQKLLYLKSSLTGEAEGLVHNFATTAENYDIAWSTLKNRYENKRVLVNVLLKKLLAQPSATHETVSSLKQLHDTTQECLHSLQNLGIATDNWDPIILHILVQRLSKQTHVLWEQSLVDPQALPSLHQFLIRMLNQVLDTSGGSIQFFKTKLRVKEQHYEHANALHTKL